MLLCTSCDTKYVITHIHYMVVEQQEHCSASHTYLFRHFCAGSLWHDFSEEARQHYIQKLTSVCALSKMFDAESKVLHLNYRSHENIFCETFGMENLASCDLSFDCIANMNGRNVGVGLKTFSDGYPAQKIAEFNTMSHLFHGKDDEELVLAVALLRNERMMGDIKELGVDRAIYHTIVRGNTTLHIFEEPYELIDIGRLKITGKNKSTVFFEDGKACYSFRKTKNTLFKRFFTSNDRWYQQTQINVNVVENPFQIIDKVLQTI